MKKFLIRFIGALCILGAVAALFMPAWLKIEGVKRSEMRDLRSDVTGAIEEVGDSFAEYAASSEDFADELQDNDLPHTRSSIRKQFGEIGDLAENLLDEEVSLQEVLMLSVKAPGIIQVAENMVDSSASYFFVRRVSQFLINEAIESNPDAYFSDEKVQKFERKLQSDLEDGVDVLSDLSFIFTALTAVLFLILALALLSAIMHMCNKGRWVKYLLLVFMVFIVVGSAVAVPLTSSLIEDMVELEAPFEDLSLQMTVMPYIALALMFVPVVLDIIFERKKKAALATEGFAVVDNNNYFIPQPVSEQPEQVQPEAVQEQQPEQAPEQGGVWDSYQDPADNNQPAISEYQQNIYFVPAQPPKKKKGKKILIWSGVIAAVLAVGAAAFLLLSNTYKTPINILEKQANAKKAGNPYDQRIEMLNGFCAKEQKAIYKILKKTDNYEDNLEDYEDSFEERIESRIDEYGDDYKVTYEIIDKEELDRDELKEIRNSIRDRGENMLDQFEDMDSDDYEEGAEALGLTKSQAKEIVKNMKAIGKKLKSAKVTEGYTLTVVTTITGSELDEPEEQEQEINVYKIDGRWISASGLYVIGLLY